LEEVANNRVNNKASKGYQETAKPIKKRNESVRYEKEKKQARKKAKTRKEIKPKAERKDIRAIFIARLQG